MHSILFVNLASLVPLISAQWIYPPPLPSDKTLADYTSGKAQPILDFLEHDMLIGDFKTPKPAMSITRCAKEGHTEPILPSSESFNSTQGRITADGTWQMMDAWIDWYTMNVYSKGKNIWVVANFENVVGNDTTGRICWWELYSRSERQVQTPFDPVTGISKVLPEVTLIGEDTENYFASTPFIIGTTKRAGGENYTWRAGSSHGSPTTISISNRPTSNAAPSLWTHVEQKGPLSLVLSVIGMMFGLRV